MKSKIQLFFFGILCLSFFSSTAQKIRGQYANTTALHYPIIALPDSFKTYQGRIVKLGININEFKNEIDPAKIQLQNFQRVQGKGDLNITIVVEKIKLSHLYSNKQINSLDELKGLSVETLINYTVTLRYEVTDKRGITIQKETFVNNGLYTYDAPEALPIQSKAVDIVKNVTNYIDNGINTITVRLRDLLDTYREPYQTEFYIIKASKTESYEGFTTAVEKLEPGLKASMNDEVASKKIIKESIEFWEGKLGSFDLALEDGKAHYFLSTFNLAIAYCLLDDFDKSLEYVEKTKATGYKPGYAGMMQNEIMKRKKIKDQYLAEKEKLVQNPNNIYQKGNPEKSELETKLANTFSLGKKSEPAPASEFMEKGFIFSPNGDTLLGNFIEFDHNLKNGKLLFLENGKSQKTFVTPKVISIRGLIYYAGGSEMKKVLYYSPSLLVLSTKSEVIFGFISQDKTAVYKMFDSADGASYMTNYKKKLAEAFKGVCASVEQKALGGDYPLKQDGLKFVEQVVKDFEGECGSKEYEKYTKLLAPEKIQSRYK